MRGISSLYLFACEQEGCLTNSRLVAYFAALDQMSTRDESLREACPSELDLTSNYLGDAGTAAVFRTLHVLRWVKRVDARGVGAGPRAVKALASVLSAATPVASTMTNSTSGATAPALDKDTRDSLSEVETDNAIGKNPAPVVELEFVDLRENEIYTSSGRLLVKALKARRRWLQDAAGQFRFAPPPPLVVYVDLTNLQPTLAAALEAINESELSESRRREQAREEHKERERQMVFCVTISDESSGATPTGERVIFRIPETVPQTAAALGSEDSQEAFYPRSHDSLARLVHNINDYMESYLVTYRAYTALCKVSGSSEFQIPERAAAQLCVELGADALCALPQTNAAVWYWLAQGSLSDLGDNELSDNVGLDGRFVLEIMANVGALIRGFCVNPLLEDELSASRGGVISQYIHRLRECYYTYDAMTRLKRSPEYTSTGNPASNEEFPYEYEASDTVHALRQAWQEKLDASNAIGAEQQRRKQTALLGEMESLYARVVSAIVAKPLTDIPSMAHVEQRVAAIRSLMLVELLEGTDDKELERRKKRIREDTLLLHQRSEAARPLQPHPAADDGNALQVVHQSSITTGTRVTGGVTPYRRIWPLWCAQLKYHLQNHEAEAREWNKAYIPDRRSVCLDKGAQDQQKIPPPRLCYQSFSRCTCAQLHTNDNVVKGGTTALVHHPMSQTPPRPCPACCHRAICAARVVLNDEHALRRLELMEPISAVLPMEVKHFFMDLVGRGLSTFAYVPSMFGQGTRLQMHSLSPSSENNNKGGWGRTAMPLACSWKLLSPADFIAHVDGRQDRLIELLGGFSEWYRLRMIESFGGNYPFKTSPSPLGSSGERGQ